MNKISYTKNDIFVGMFSTELIRAYAQKSNKLSLKQRDFETLY